MQNILYRMSQTPGKISWTGRKIGEDTESILKSELNYTDKKFQHLLSLNVIAQSDKEMK